MKRFTLRSLTFPVAVLALSLAAACEEQGPAEQAGEKIDEAAEEAGEAIERAGERSD